MIFFLVLKASVYETLKDNYNDKYEYILPEIIFDKNLFTSNKFGNADFQSNIKVHNYDTNKFTKFFVNNIDWTFKNINFDSGLTGQFLAKLKNVNYEAKNTSIFKNDTTSEFFGALGYLTRLIYLNNLIMKQNISYHQKHYLNTRQIICVKRLKN